MSLFGISWFCIRCGRDFCNNCFASLKVRLFRSIIVLTFNIFIKGSTASQISSVNNCGQLRGVHNSADFIPCSRFVKAHLLNILQSMKSLLDNGKYYLPVQNFFFNRTTISNLPTSTSILRIPQKNLRIQEFRIFLGQRIPLVITGLNDSLQLSWDPRLLTRQYGEDDCTMEDCEGVAQPATTTLGHFLSHFETDGEAGQQSKNIIWKVKVSSQLQSHLHR